MPWAKGAGKGGNRVIGGEAKSQGPQARGPWNAQPRNLKGIL